MWILDAGTGQPIRVAARCPSPFTVEFRANWVDGGSALVVTRAENSSQVVRFDRYWMERPPDAP